MDDNIPSNTMKITPYTPSFRLIFSPNCLLLKATISLACLTLISCDNGKDQQAEEAKIEIETVEPSAQSEHIDLSHARKIMWASIDRPLEDLKKSAEVLEQSTQDFLNTPSSESLASAQASWQALNKETHKISLLKWLAQAKPATFSKIAPLDYRIEAHPIQPGYLDRFGDYKISGLVYDIGTALTPKTLIEQHGATDEEEVVLGLYAIEFMLFGENNHRSYLDYVKKTTLSAEQREQGLASIDEIPVNRRRMLLSLQLSQLLVDIQSLQEEIKTGSTSYTAWASLSPQQQISTARRAANAALTHSLISVAHLQSMADTEQQNALASDIPTHINDEEFVKQSEAIRAQLYALNGLREYYPSLEREPLKNAISTSIELLANLPSLQAKEKNTQDTSPVRAQLQKVYELLKPLI